MKFELLPWIIVIALVGALALMTTYYLDERDALTVCRAQAEQAARDQEGEKARIEGQHRENLAAVKEDYEKRLPEVRALAVRNYRRLRDDAATRERVSLSLAPAGVAVDAGAAEKCVVVGGDADSLTPGPSPGGRGEDEFVTGCAEDALKVFAWQDWAKRNGVPSE